MGFEQMGFCFLRGGVQFSEIIVTRMCDRVIYCDYERIDWGDGEDREGEERKILLIFPIILSPISDDAHICTDMLRPSLNYVIKERQSSAQLDERSGGYRAILQGIQQMFCRLQLRYHRSFLRKIKPKVTELAALHHSKGQTLGWGPITGLFKRGELHPHPRKGSGPAV